MQIYMYMFFFSALLLYLSEKVHERRIKKVCAVLGLLLPCVLGGIRHYTIGTDVNVYLRPLFQNATISTSFIEYISSHWWYIWSYKHVANFEYGFNVLVYLVAKSTGNIQILMFLIQTLIILPIYFALKKYKELQGKIWFAMLTFYLLLYNNSFNVMRQYIGISFVFYGTSCLLIEKKELNFIISLIIAYFFHKSSLIGILIFFIYKIFKKKRDGKTIKVKMGENEISLKSLLIVVAFIAGLLIMGNLKQITLLLENIGLSKYAGYISGEVYFKGTNFIKILPVVILFFINRKSFFEKSNNSYIYIIFFCIDFLSSYLSSVNIYAARIGYIFQTFNIITFTHIVFATENKKKRKFNKLYMLAYLSYYWYFTYMHGGVGQTIPFKPYWK